jgi:TPR repeat protein
MNIPEEDQRQYLNDACILLEQRDFLPARALLINLFNGSDPDIAERLGFLHSQKDSDVYDLEQAEKYYLIAAQQACPAAHNGLAVIYGRRQEFDTAIFHLNEASIGGYAESSWQLYWLHKRKRRARLAQQFFDLAVAQDHPLAVQRLAWQDVLLRNGLSNFSRGVRKLIHNTPRTIRYFHEHKHNF